MTVDAINLADRLIMSTEGWAVVDELIDLLGEVSAGFQMRLQGLPALQVLRLAPFQARLLALVARQPNCSQQELAAWTARDKAQVARTVKDLEVRGYLVRSAHRSDWRAQSVAVTTEGESAYMILSQERTSLASEATQDLTLEERAIVIRALTGITLRLSEGHAKQEGVR